MGTTLVIPPDKPAFEHHVYWSPMPRPTCFQGTNTMTTTTICHLYPDSPSLFPDHQAYLSPTAFLPAYWSTISMTIPPTGHDFPDCPLS